MTKSLSQFLTENLDYTIARSVMQINEAFSQKDFAKAISLLRSVLSKKGHGTAPGLVKATINGKPHYILTAISKDEDNAVSINFADNTRNLSPDSITFYALGDDITDFVAAIAIGDKTCTKAFDGETYNTAGAGIAAIVKVVLNILDGMAPESAMQLLWTNGISESDDAAVDMLNEALSYQDWYNNMLVGGVDNKWNAAQKIKRLEGVLKRALKAGDSEWVTKAQQALDLLRNGEWPEGMEPAKKTSRGAAAAASTDTTPKKTKTKIVVTAEDIDNFWDDLLGSKQTARQKIADMCSYVEQIKKMRFNVGVFAGAPGIGKTYNVEKILGSGAHSTFGKDWNSIKGTITPNQLFKELFLCRHYGQVLVLDDCDSIISDQFGDAVNILKGACDDKPVRYITWGKKGFKGSSGVECDPEDVEELNAELVAEFGTAGFADAERLNAQSTANDDEEDDGDEQTVAVNMPNVPDKRLLPVAFTKRDGETFAYLPKRFKFEGAVIILTNKQLNQVAEPLRGRGVAMDLFFTEAEKVDLVHDVMPSLESEKEGIVLTNDIKNDAFEFLKEIAEKADAAKQAGKPMPMGVSIRVFKIMAMAMAMYRDQPMAVQRRHAVNILRGVSA